MICTGVSPKFRQGRVEIHSADAIITLQEATEAYMVRIFEDTNLCCHTCKAGDNHAKGCPAGSKIERREGLNQTTHQKTRTLGPFQDHQIFPKAFPEKLKSPVFKINYF